MRSTRLAFMLVLLTAPVAAAAQVAAPPKADPTLCELTGECGDQAPAQPKKPPSDKAFKLGEVKRVETVRSPQMPQSPNPNRRKSPTVQRGGGEVTIAFAPGVVDLSPEAAQTLNITARGFNQPALSARRFVVEGHNSRGSVPGAGLSQRRAEAVRRALIERGVAPERLEAIGYGAGRPLPDVTPDDPRNDRVELRLVP